MQSKDTEARTSHQPAPQLRATCHFGFSVIYFFYRSALRPRMSAARDGWIDGWIVTLLTASSRAPQTPTRVPSKQKHRTAIGDADVDHFGIFWPTEPGPMFYAFHPSQAPPFSEEGFGGYQPSRRSVRMFFAVNHGE